MFYTGLNIVFRKMLRKLGKGYLTLKKNTQKTFLQSTTVNALFTNETLGAFTVKLIKDSIFFITLVTLVRVAANIRRDKNKKYSY